MFEHYFDNQNNQSASDQSKRDHIEFSKGRILGKHEKWCLNQKCILINGEIGVWRMDQGRKGGGKNWCKGCLKNEEKNLQKIFRDTYGVQYFICQNCPIEKKVRIVKPNPKQKRKGTEHLVQHQLCQNCFDSSKQVKDVVFNGPIFQDNIEQSIQQTAAKSNLNSQRQTQKEQESVSIQNQRASSIFTSNFKSIQASQILIPERLTQPKSNFNDFTLTRQTPFDQNLNKRSVKLSQKDINQKVNLVPHLNIHSIQKINLLANDEETFILHSEDEDETKDTSATQSLIQKQMVQDSSKVHLRSTQEASLFDDEKFQRASLLLKDLNETIKNQRANPSPIFENVLKRQVSGLHELINE